MAQLLIRGLDEAVKRRLQERALRHGVSMEAEAREILTRSLREPGSRFGADPFRGGCGRRGRTGPSSAFGDAAADRVQVTTPQVLDTNVVSELVRPAPDPAVLEWMRFMVRTRT